MKNSKIIKTTKHHEGLFAETIFIFLLTIIPFFVFLKQKQLQEILSMQMKIRLLGQPLW